MTNTRKPTVLTDLPLELLLMISDHLSVVDIACLALCNYHLMASFIDTKSAFDNFSKRRIIDLNDAVRIEFMTRLAHDLPPYYLCFGCLRLHRWWNIELPGPHFDFLNLPKCFKPLSYNDRYGHRRRALELEYYPSYTRCQLHFVHVQLAMRRFYCGPRFGLKAESFFSTEVAIHSLENGTLGPIANEKPHDNIMTTLTSIEARICPAPSPGLCVRAQELAVVRRQNVSQLRPKLKAGYMRTCGHMSTILPDFWQIMDPLLDRFSSDSAPTHVSDQGRCRKCNTSWKLELRDVGPGDACLVLTKWMDLGPGLSPEDPRWLCHLSTIPRVSLADDELVSDPQARFERDSIQATKADALSDEEMFNRNMSLLRRHEYQINMTKVGRSRWFLNAEEAKKREQTKKREISRCIIL
ncbi:uncharacterized protein KD926_002439 [Aspergillus affinis]|uniref:uncharacterized protein n=1 Tax=Aspergillus affinis TaxID=1070780 RepID=UPI0022FDC0C3|nr:uncharacterized protein KD926_002439 [Aspergillus affinis]KAI9036107.1 hypothetical protein KD926_002439 [Aspergillus affinis]